MTDELNIRVGVTSTTAAAFSKIRTQTGRLRSSLKITRPTMVGLGAAARKMAATMAGPAVRGAQRLWVKLKALRTQGGLTRRVLGGLGGFLRGAFTAGIIGAGIAVAGLRSAFSGMYDAMEGGDGVGGALEGVDEQANSAADGLSKAAKTSAAAAEQIGGAFGAWGQVGEGFVQAQGQLAGQAAAAASGALDTAKDAADGMDNARDSIDGASQATTRFGKAANRISAAFAKAKRIILQAIAKAITPALEKFADLLESPTFQKFVDLLAKDLAKAAEKVADWLVKDVIPAVEDLMERINDAGGPIEFIKGKFQEWKTTALMILAIIVGRILIASNYLREKFKTAIDSVKRFFQTLKDDIKTAMQEAADFVSMAFDGAVESIRLAINGIITAVEGAINSAIGLLRPFVDMYNAVAEASGGSKIDLPGKIALPRLAEGAIAMRPMAAIVGDSPGGEAVVPLNELPGIIREALGGAGGTNIYVTVPPGTNNPQAFGDAVGSSIVTALRRGGVRVPTI